jgi:CubicO group peptidase (beta-lactamase class C family)
MLCAMKTTDTPKRFAIFAMLILVLVAAGVAGAAGLPSATPEQVGLSSERLDRIGQILRADVEKGRIPGAVVVVARRGRVATVQVAGFRDKDAGLAMTSDTIFRLASMTKPMVTVAALVLYEEGRLLLSDPVSKHLPALGKPQVGVERVDAATGKTVLTTVPADREMTIQDLMRHTSGLTYGNRGKTDLYKAYPESSTRASMTLTGAQLIEQLAKAPLVHQPGTVWEYGLSTDVLGLVVEAVAQKPLGAFLEERIFRPLKMTDTHFTVPADKRARVAQPLKSHPDTGAAYTLSDPTVPRKFECGGACANATAGDYVRFAQMLLDRGSLDGARVLGPRTVEYMTSDHLGKISRGLFTFAGPAYTWGLGVAVRQEKGLSAIPGSPGDFFWPGAFTTYWWADPKEQMVVVSMLQAPLGRHYQETVRSLVYQAIVE